MRVALLVVAVGLLAGCASSRTTGSLSPGTLPAPTTLQGVNAVLLDTQATVHFSDSRPPFRAFVRITPETTTLKVWNGISFDAPREIATHEIAFVEVDDSQSVGQGAWRGLKYGTLTGVTTIGFGVALSAVDERGEGNWFSPGETIVIMGVLGTAALTPVATLLGAVSTARHYPVVVYRAPVSRYPDAVPEQRVSLPDSPIFLSRAAD